jgi:hypothetical protein
MSVACVFHFSPFHSRATLHFATFRLITFIVRHKPRQPMQECFHSFHFAQAYPPFHSAPLWLSFPPAGTQSQNEKLHSTLFKSLPCIQSPPLLFPMPTSGMPCEVFTPVNQRPQNSPPPFNCAGKNKGSFAQGNFNNLKWKFE